MPNQVVWFEMPVTNVDRAVQFYSAVLGAPIKKEEHNGTPYACLPHQENEVSGMLLPPGGCGATAPSRQGALLYFNCQGRLDAAIGAVAPNGGQVLQPKEPIGPYGFRTIVLDSEGNRIALHSM